MNFSVFLSLAAFRTRSSACDTPTRSCARSVLCRLAFSLVPALGSTDSAASGLDPDALFAGFLAFPMRTGSILPEASPLAAERSTARSPGSRAENVRTCQGLRPRRAVRALAFSAPGRFAFHHSDSVGTRLCSFSRLYSLAYARPCQRFAGGLATVCA